VATNMLASKTHLGSVPALLSTELAIALAIPYLESADAMVKPPSKSMIVGENMAEKMSVVAALVERVAPEVGSLMT